LFERSTNLYIKKIPLKIEPVKFSCLRTPDVYDNYSETILEQTAESN